MLKSPTCPPRLSTPPAGRMQALLVVLVAACVIAVTAATASRQLVITQSDSGKTFRLVVGADAEFHLSGRWTWSEPVVHGQAVDLVQINYFRDPGYSGWAVDPKAPGRVTIRSKGPLPARLAPAPCDGSP